MRSHFDFQVENPEEFQLPTLKQLIGHQSNPTSYKREEIIRVTQLPRRSSLSSHLIANSLRRSFSTQEVGDILIDIIDGKGNIPDESLLLDLPKNKSNETIHQTVLQIKIVNSNGSGENREPEHEENVTNTNLLTDERMMEQRRVMKDVKGVSTSMEPLELERSESKHRSRSNRRRLRVDPSLSTSTKDSKTSQSTSVQIVEKLSSQNTSVELSTRGHVQTTENATIQSTLVHINKKSLPVNTRAADIERAKRRRIRYNSSQPASPIHSKTGLHLRRRPSRRRNRVPNPESTTLVSITTSRGTTLPETTTGSPRGFLLTRNIDDISVRKEDELSLANSPSSYFSTIPTTEKDLYSTKPSTDSPTTIEYSESSSIASSLLIEGTNQVGETDFFLTTTDITHNNEDYDQPNETTNGISETTMPNLENDANYMDTSMSKEISSTAQPLTPYYRYMEKKNIRTAEPLNSFNFSDFKSFKPSMEDRNILPNEATTAVSEETTDSSLRNLDSSTTFDLISSTISDSVYLEPSSTTTATSVVTSSATSNLMIMSTKLNRISDPILSTTGASGSASTTEYLFLETNDSIKPDSNFLEFVTITPHSFPTELYLQEQKNSYVDFEKRNLGTEETKILDNVSTTEKGDTIVSTLSPFSSMETTPMSIHQNRNQTDTSIDKFSITDAPNSSYTSSLIQLGDQISTGSPIKVSEKVVDELVSVSDEPTNSRRRLLKRKQQRIDPKSKEKSMQVAKTKTVEVTPKREQDLTTPVSISSTELETPSRKRFVVNRGTRRFSSKTTPPTVQSSPDTRDHPNQIVSQRKTKKVVKERTKIPPATTLGSDLSKPGDDLNQREEHLSLDPETKRYKDADQAGSEVIEKLGNVHSSLTPILRRPGSLYHREANRIGSRDSTRQPLTITQPTLRRFSSSSPRRQSLHFEETTSSSKIRFASLDDAAILLKHLARIEDQRAENDDQTNRAHEVVLGGLETTPSTAEPGHSSLKTVFWRKISTTEMPKTLATTAIPAFRRRQGQKYYSEVISQNLPQRPRRPAIVDYDYYEDEEVRFVGKPRLNGKLYVTSRGSINCLDQGNFPHPISCRKFITCARMVNGQVVGTEYTCPDKLSFDPIGGICNWSAGLGCKE